MFIKFVILCWLLPFLFSLIQKIDFKSFSERADCRIDKKDIWKHPFLIAAGLKEEVEEVELTAVEEDERPLCWKITYNKKQTDFITILIFEE